MTNKDREAENEVASTHSIISLAKKRKKKKKGKEVHELVCSTEGLRRKRVYGYVKGMIHMKKKIQFSTRARSLTHTHTNITTKNFTFQLLMLQQYGQLCWSMNEALTFGTLISANSRWCVCVKLCKVLQ